MIEIMEFIRMERDIWKGMDILGGTEREIGR